MLLEKLLKHLAEDGVHSLTELALMLDVDLNLLEQMLHDLERAGYLRQVETSCDTEQSCTGCPRQGTCRLLHAGRVWTLTPKGMQAAKGV